MDIDTQMPALVTVADIQFKNGGKSYSFDPGQLELEPGQEVIIDTQRGLEYGICQRGNHNVLADQVVQPLRPVVRLATDADRQRLRDNAEREGHAFNTCQRFIERLQLDMKLVRVENAFDGSKMLFFFTSDGRVDFRELVKELASIYRTRIEMRQIGVRDEAKLLGGLGICGRPFCCSQFLDDFQPVSIKMAKTQSLSLNPTKISGTCGRLMCCLKYEQDAYEDLIRHSPRQGSFVDTVDGRGTVQDVSLLRQQVKVSLEDAPETVKYYPNDEIAVLRDGKGKKTDPPIPRDIAPISGDPVRRAQLQHAAPGEEALPEISYHTDRVEPKPPRRRERSNPPAPTAAPEPAAERIPAPGNNAPNASHNRNQRPHRSSRPARPKAEAAPRADGAPGNPPGGNAGNYKDGNPGGNFQRRRSRRNYRGPKPNGGDAGNPS